MPPGPATTATWQHGESGPQNRFDAFKPEADAKPAEPATPQVRNGKVLLVVLTAAVLILAVPLGLLLLLGKIGGDDTPAQPAFNPAVGSCVKEADKKVVAVDCGEPDAFTVVSKVDDVTKCADPKQPSVKVGTSNGKDQVFCLKPAAAK